ncbi:uncharacterized protein LOC114314222 [Camellia sinensis]|uniref:uncharacterized protein LOC114314222 n=1 Tax=Camellia sinensis TaxID=4442 RepID=UPI001035DC15|nr:uncharacterized protein LOC114314222 [Camellia sinensis]
MTPAKRPRNTGRISFDDSDLVGVTHPHTDPLVIELHVNRFTIKRVLIDQGSTSEIMNYKTFVKHGFTDSLLSPADYPLFGFNASLEYPLGKITLPVRAGTKSIDVEFLVVKLPSLYNLIMGRTWLHTMQAVPSTYHQLLRFPIEYDIKQICGSQKSTQACYLLAAKRPRELEVHLIEVLDRESLDDIGRIPSEKATEALHQVEIDRNLNQLFMIGASLDNVERQELVAFLLKNIDMFAWSPYEMPGVDPLVAQHRLNVDPKCKPIIQRSRRTAAEHTSAVVEEVDRLLETEAVREVAYPTWLSNTVVVKKKNGSWRVCVDFTDLNKACPKDWATYQRLLTSMFKEQLGRTMEVCIDNMVVKSNEKHSHLADLSETFGILRKYKMKLNASKCAFGIGSGKFLVYIVNHRGIEANPRQITAILELGSPRSVKEVQKPMEMDAAALDGLKSYLRSVPLLATLAAGDPLILYLAVSDQAVSTVLLKEELGEQRPVYYVRKAMVDAETRYLPLEKLILALVMATRKLMHYFQGHTIGVPTEYPL